MNARLYDPLLHRFLQPDNYVQDPFNTQNYNRYAYVLNNPLKYTDPSGEIWNIVIGAAIGGTLNWAFNGCQFNAKGLGYFGVGAAAGALTAIGAAGVSSLLGGGSFMAGALGTSSAWACTATSSFINGAIIGASGGLAGGFATGFGNSMVDGKGIGDCFKNGIRDGGIGAITGGLIGGVAGGIDAALDGRRFFDGATVVKETAVPAYTLSDLTQSSPSSCQATVAASIDQSYGGTLTEMDVRNMMPGYQYENGGASDISFWKEFASKTGRYVKAANATDKGELVFSDILRYPNGRYALSLPGHAVGLQSVTKVTITKLSGKIGTKFLYNVMDPYYGKTMTVSSKSIINLFLMLSR